jgi:hypothetical protein
VQCVSSKLDAFTSFLHESTRVPLIDLPDLLIEVDQWTDFAKELRHLSGQEPRRSDFLPTLYAALLSQGCNFGFARMAQMADIAADRLAYCCASQSLQSWPGSSNSRWPHQNPLTRSVTVHWPRRCRPTGSVLTLGQPTRGRTVCIYAIARKGGSVQFQILLEFEYKCFIGSEICRCEIFCTPEKACAIPKEGFRLLDVSFTPLWGCPSFWVDSSPNFYSVR